MSAYDGFAALYDTLMDDVDYDVWARYIDSLINKRGAYIADCACGTGEVTVRLAKLGHRLTGIDISEQMLAVAAEKARLCAQNIPFVRQDIRKLALHRPVDAVISTCDGVNYLNSREAMAGFFRSAYAALKPGGLIAFDISTRYKLKYVLANNTFAYDGGDAAYIWKNEYDDESRLIRMELSFFKKRGELYEKFSEEHIQRAHSEKEVESALAQAGFVDIAAYDAFTQSAPHEQSERIQFTAKKE